MSAEATHPAARSGQIELARGAVEHAARAYAAFTHANLGDPRAYRAREEARERLLDALARLDRARGLA